jgi:two-component system, NtrC family, response regulator GlrR
MTIILIIAGGVALLSFIFCLAFCRMASTPLPTIGHQNDTILAIDDDPEMLNIEKLALESEGYNVHAVSSPQEGLKFYAEHWQNIKLVLLDYLMPEMTGDRVFALLQEIDPQVPVLLVTGYYDRIPANKLQSGICGYLPKPFSLDNLTNRVRGIVEFA